jgi:mycothiol synthase
MGEPVLPDGLSAKPARRSDAERVAAVLVACEEHDGGIVDVELADVVADWSQPGVDLATMTTIVFDGVEAVGYAEVFMGRAEVAVLPSHRGRGIGTALESFVRAAAARDGCRAVEQVVPDERIDATALLSSHGYVPVRTSWSLEIDVTGAAHPRVPAPYEMADLVAHGRALAAHEVIETAFSEWPGRRATAFEVWTALVLHDERFDPVASAVALHDGDIVGVAICFDYGTECWVHQLAVAAPHRGRGLGRALLAEVFARAAGRGHTTVGVSTDSRTGALTLYEHVGMRVRRTYTRWSRTLAAA